MPEMLNEAQLALVETTRTFAADVLLPLAETDATSVPLWSNLDSNQTSPSDR